MKKKLLLFIFIVFSLSAQARQGNRIIGRWWNKGHEGQIEIYQLGRQYFGKLVWVKQPENSKGQPLTDQRNIRPGLRDRPLLGLVILTGFVCEGQSYTGGKIYDPRRGKNFNCILTLNGAKLKVEALMGMFPLGSEEWMRVKN